MLGAEISKGWYSACSNFSVIGGPGNNPGCIANLKRPAASDFVLSPEGLPMAVTMAFETGTCFMELGSALMTAPLSITVFLDARHVGIRTATPATITPAAIQLKVFCVRPMLI